MLLGYRLYRYANIKDIIHRALVTAAVPVVREPNGLIRDDGMRADGMSLQPWKMGRPFVSDATCLNTLVIYHLPSTAGYAGSATALQKASNYYFLIF